ncbi:c-type cytochrome [Sphingobium sp. CR28]|uniref:c-type cytochrome n=1 Tax=Sphingobium sp. CR28 TaxID=3400272 RepID=UPI003FEEE36F
MSILALGLAGLAALGGAAASEPQLQASAAMSWAYPVNPPATPSAPAAPDAAEVLHIQGSSVTFTARQVRNIFAAPDWTPQEHPPMPAVVATGRRPDVMACGYCHLPTGTGRPENAPLAGLPRDYIIAQMDDIHGGVRSSAVSGRVPTDLMRRVATVATSEEVAAAASYFSALPFRSFVTVVEAASIPKVKVAAWTYARSGEPGTEPLGQRIIEVPDSFEQFEMRDPHTRYTAFVPVGSILRGARLVRQWGDGSLACAGCHGAGYRGTSDVPGLAGRSPTFLVRQLYDFQTGARGGEHAALMTQVVEDMRGDDMIAVAAYLASLKP